MEINSPVSLAVVPGMLALAWLSLYGRKVPLWYSAAVLGAFALPAFAHGAGPAYEEVVSRTANMVGDAEVQRLAAAHGLQVMNVTWEDTGRFKNSAVGPNISDMTIQVQQAGSREGQFSLTSMPVIRFPNFDDKSADVSTEKFFLLVGNEKGDQLKAVSLRDYLGGIRQYLGQPKSWQGDRTSLLANRDSHVLVSAQACFLPVPKEGIAEFNPVLFNYQSMPGDPAVLTILATREGTSATVIDNKRDSVGGRMGGGQRLFFNHKGERASLTGQRMSDFQATATPGTTTSVGAAGQKGLNMVLLIQVPLKRKAVECGPQEMALCQPCCADAAAPAGRGGDVEAAVIGHGKVQGPFTEIDNLPIERDYRFPVRVTVQFYKATSNGVVSKDDMAEIAAQIDKVYAQADYVGSLVTDGATERPTEYDGDKVQPAEWWADFWARHARETGYDRAAVIERVRETRGPEWTPLTENELLRETGESALPKRHLRGLGYALAHFWDGTGATERLLLAAMLLVVGVVVYDLGQRGIRRLASAR